MNINLISNELLSQSLSRAEFEETRLLIKQSQLDSIEFLSGCFASIFANILPLYFNVNTRKVADSLTKELEKLMGSEIMNEQIFKKQSITLLL